jgi:hypothetical protein
MRINPVRKKTKRACLVEKPGVFLQWLSALKPTKIIRE